MSSVAEHHITDNTLPIQHRITRTYYEANRVLVCQCRDCGWARSFIDNHGGDVGFRLIADRIITNERAS